MRRDSVGVRSAVWYLPLAASCAPATRKESAKGPIIVMTAASVAVMAVTCRRMKGSWDAVATSSRVVCRKRWSL